MNIKIRCFHCYGPLREIGTEFAFCIKCGTVFNKEVITELNQNWELEMEKERGKNE